jgi:hypothetical protein
MSCTCWLASETGMSPPMIGATTASPSPQIGDIGGDGARCSSCIQKNV